MRSDDFKKYFSTPPRTTAYRTNNKKIPEETSFSLLFSLDLETLVEAGGTQLGIGWIFAGPF